MKTSLTIVDMFCGGGGESEGIEEALNEKEMQAQVFAINHWERAIETHAANFPRTEHICRNIEDVDPIKVIREGYVALLWASPACTHFSVARGGKPRSDQSRVTPFTILDWLDKLTVDRVIIENVPEFQSWGPLDESGRPVHNARGETFRAFIGMIQSLGYDVGFRVLNAADFGAPTTRRRLFIQAVRRGSGKRIMWPNSTHAPMGSSNMFDQGLPAWVPARDIIDWTIPTQIIDERQHPLAANTMRRIIRGIEKFWPDNIARPFLVRYNGGNERSHPLDDPVPVLDTSNRYGLVEPFPIAVTHGGREYDPSAPLPTITSAHRGLVEPLLVEYYGNGQTKPISEPVGVITTKDRFGLVTAENVRLGFRMLAPHELAAAQSFPHGYIFKGNKGEVVKQIGNAVCPAQAKALVKAVLG